MSSADPRPVFRQLQPLRLEIEGRETTFDSLEAFELALASRTEFTRAQRLDLRKRDNGLLAAETRALHKSETTLRRLLWQCTENPGAVGAEAAGDGAVFGEDHGWRDILIGILSCTSDYDEWKRRALSRYMQYFLARKRALYDVCLERRPGDAEEGSDEEDADEADAVTRMRAATNHLVEAAPEEAHPEEAHVVRLPRGKRVVLHSVSSRGMSLRIASHGFRLVLRGGIAFLVEDESAEQWALGDGKVSVGRSLDNDVVVAALYMDVSRRHLLMEIEKGVPVAITDTSSRGTYLPRNLLEERY